MSIFMGTELNSSLLNLFDKKVSTVIVATTDEKNHPHTAPFHYIAVRDSKHIRIAIFKENFTFRNIINNQYVALAILDEGDIAVTVKGIGKLVLENMKSDAKMAVIEVEGLEVKKDNLFSHFVTQGIRIHHKNELFF